MNAEVSGLQRDGFKGGSGSFTEALRLHLGGIETPPGHPGGPLNCDVQPVRWCLDPRQINFFLKKGIVETLHQILHKRVDKLPLLYSHNHSFCRWKKTLSPSTWSSWPHGVVFIAPSSFRQPGI